MNTDKDIAGAIFDFAAYLTVLDEPYVVGAKHDASRMVDELKKWAEKRNLSTTDPNLNWDRNNHQQIELREKIARAINSVSAENGSDTPDFILAEFLTDCLNAFDNAVHRRSRWYGHHQTILGEQ